jgi:hypothetical protein
MLKRLIVALSAVGAVAWLAAAPADADHLQN